MLFLFFALVGLFVVWLVLNTRNERREAIRRAAVADSESRHAAARAAADEAARQAAKAAKDAEKERRQAEAQRKRDARLEGARKLAEYRERALLAEREMRELRRQPADARPDAAHAVQEMTLAQFCARVRAQAPAQDAGKTGEAPAEEAPAPAQTYAGEVVAFTGKLPGMTRREAIAAVRARGGRAFDSMPAGTTVLVVGATNGNNTRKLDKADEWIGQVRKITAAQFIASLTT